MLTIFALLVFGHLLADYPLQGDFLARGKFGIPGVPRVTILLSHAAIHAGVVLVITGSLWLMLAEFLAHAAIDEAKIKGRLGQGERAFNIDQSLHIACKAMWCALLAGGVA